MTKKKIQQKQFNIIINFKKIKKNKKNITESIYKKKVPYNNDDLPNVRFPIIYSVPTHLLNEFNIIFPDNEYKKGKIKLVPSKIIGGKENSLLKFLFFSFWKNTNYLDELSKILLHKKEITLTHLDWLCVNYSKIFNIHYKLENNLNDFYIYESYNQKLGLHLRSFFGVFARSTRILIEWVTNDDIFFDNFIGNKIDNLGK